MRAKALYTRDKEYVVRDGEVVIVDEFTGRLQPGRRWSEGLHQAIEAKEGLRVQRESVTMATITFQNYFRLYEKLAGMTGTAETEAEEFSKIYNLEVAAIPTHRPMVRVDEPDLVFRTEKAKDDAIVEHIAERRAAGQPVLVGTTSVERSEHLAGLLKRAGIPHNVLNAKQHDREAPIVAQAGRSGAVTIATNMAGRGTDILLGGNPAGLASEALRIKGLNPAEVDAETYAAALAEAERSCAADREKVLAAGGLRIIGTERHESRRIDNQLRGRAGRQGDPGSSRFYLSLEDDLMRRFAGDRIVGILDRLGFDESQAIESTMVSRTIEGAQTRVEGYNFDMRKRVVEFDDVINKQRATVYSERDRVLRGENLQNTIADALSAEIRSVAIAHCPPGLPGDWRRDALRVELRRLGVEPPPTLDEIVDDKRTISLGGVDLELTYLGRNHTEGMLLMRLPREKIIFTVDWIPLQAVQFRGMADTYLPETMEGLKKVIAMDWDKLITGHPGPGGRQTGTKQIIMITDGEPTAHIPPRGDVYFNYPPVRETLEATLKEVMRCTREDIRINTFVLDATQSLRRFIEQMTQINSGRAFFTDPDNLGSYVLVDFLENRRKMARSGR